MFPRRTVLTDRLARKTRIDLCGSKHQAFEKGLDIEFITIAFFSFLQQATIPFSDLVHASFLSELDATSLGAMGVARTSQVRNLSPKQ